MLASIFDASPDVVFGTDADRRLQYLNAAACGRWPDAVLASSAGELFLGAFRDTFDAATDRVLAGGSAARFEWGEAGPGGIRAWFVCTITPLRSAGRVVGCLCLSTDTTELKRDAERLRRSEQLMVDTQGVAHLGTWEWDISEPTATWSQELYRIYGLTPETYTPSYEAYLTMVHPDDRARVVEATNRVFHEHIPYSHDERIFRPDGSIRHLHTWAHPVLDDAGTLVRLVGVCQDITDQKLAEEAVHQLNSELEKRVAERTRVIEQSVRDLEAFNAMVSHDLRAPLAVMQMSADLLMRESSQLPLKISERLSHIQRSVVHMTKLVENLLSLARVGRAPLKLVPVDLSAMATACVAELRRGDPGRSAEIVIESGIRCFGDAVLVEAMIANLLGNAWKYSAQQATVQLEVGVLDSDGDPALFIRDNGVGFDMRDADRLFAPFERLHDSSAFPGDGIGLATVHRIVQRHGGRVWATSKPGHGAAFFVVLPGLSRST